MLKYVTVVFLIASSPAVSAPDRISILLGSNHVGAADRFDEINPGVFLTWDWLTVGAYHNSYGKTSVAITGALPLIKWETGELSAFAGMALYPGNGRRFAIHAGDVVPVGGLQLRQGNMFVQVIPSDGKSVDAVVSFGVSFSFTSAYGR